MIGGDLSKAERMSLSITALGELSGNPILRSNAQIGDLLYLSALPGLSATDLIPFANSVITSELFTWLIAAATVSIDLIWGIGIGIALYLLINLVKKSNS